MLEFYIIIAQKNIFPNFLVGEYVPPFSPVSYAYASDIVLSRVCLWLFVRMSVCQHGNSQTVRDMITKFSGHRSRFQREARFENGYIGVRGWCENNVFYVLKFLSVIVLIAMSV